MKRELMSKLQLEKRQKKEGQWYRRFVVFSIVIFLALTTYLVTATVKAQRAQKELLIAQKQTTDNINRHLDCLLVYVSLPDRGKVQLEEISKCTYSRDGQNPQEFFKTDSKGDTQLKDSSSSSLKVPSQGPLPSSPSPTPSKPGKPTPHPVPRSKPLKQLLDRLKGLPDGITGRLRV